MNHQRIDLRKLALILMFVLVVPSVLLWSIDQILGTTPILTIAAILLCFPTAAFLLNRTALQEMDRVIQEVAPLLPDAEIVETEDCAEPS